MLFVGLWTWTDDHTRHYHIISISVLRYVSSYDLNPGRLNNAKSTRDTDNECNAVYPPHSLPNQLTHLSNNEMGIFTVNKEM